MKKILVLLFLPVVLVTSCVDSLDDYNISQKAAPAGSVLPVQIVSGAMRNFADLLATPNVNTNNFRLYIQQWATTTYTAEPRYDMTGRIIPQNWWQTVYRDVLSDLKEAKGIIAADPVLAAGVKANQIAQISVLEAYAWATLVISFGDVPYSQALDFNNSLPAYDDAATIYNAQLTSLDAALTSLAANSASGGIPAASDLLYAGSIAQWRKFGNSLKLKLAMVIADSDPAKSKTLSEQAIAAGVFTANTDNARINGYATSAPNNNPISANTIAPFTTRQDFVVGRTIVNKVNGLNDPRAPHWFSQVSGAYVGGTTGFPNTFASTSKPSTIIQAATAEVLILDYSEVEFLLAEAAARGYAGAGGDPAGTIAHYNAAITASITYWYGLGGATGAAAAATAYLANPDVDYLTASAYVTEAIPITVPGTVTKVALTTYKQKIGEQKYLALNNRGYEAWTEWRRLDAPTLYPVQGGTAPVGLTIPNRLIYPISEQTANGDARSAAAAKIGGDEKTTKLFWDKL